MKNIKFPFYFILIMLLFLGGHIKSANKTKNTVVSIRGEKFYINDNVTLEGITYEGVSMEGLLPNARMVQGVFDDSNPETRHLWKYPDTGEWDAQRNTNEFVAAMPEWRAHGLLSFSLNLQGGSPHGYSQKQPWDNSAFTSDGSLKEDYIKRVEIILDKADDLQMVVILGLFYFGQDERLIDEKAVVNAVNNTMDWLFLHNYKNVLVEINNECNAPKYDHEILKPERVHELIELAKGKEKGGYRYYVSTSYGGNAIPSEKVVKLSDYILLHGNGVNNPTRITDMVNISRGLKEYRPMPIIFNEDDHYNFDEPVNNMTNALKARASWGYFDFRGIKGQRGSEIDEPFEDGYQSVPVDWKISSERKKSFFEFLAEISGLKND